MSTISQQAIAARNARARPMPSFIARAKVANGWVSIGAAWPLRSGEEGLSLKLTTIPLNWDGRFVLLPPLPTEEVDEQQPDEPEVPARSRRRKDEETPSS